MMHTCTSESQLAAVLKLASKQGSGAKLWFNITRPAASSPSQPALTLEAALRMLQEHYSLQAFSVLDALSATHRCKLDRDASSIYCSLLAFSCDANATLALNENADNTPAALGHVPGALLRGENLPETPISGNGAGERPSLSQIPFYIWLVLGSPQQAVPPCTGSITQRYRNMQHSSGTLHDLLHLGLQPGMVGDGPLLSTLSHCYPHVIYALSCTPAVCPMEAGCPAGGHGYGSVAEGLLLPDSNMPHQHLPRRRGDG